MRVPWGPAVVVVGKGAVNENVEVDGRPIFEDELVCCESLDMVV